MMYDEFFYETVKKWMKHVNETLDAMRMRMNYIEAEIKKLDEMYEDDF